MSENINFSSLLWKNSLIHYSWNKELSEFIDPQTGKTNIELCRNLLGPKYSNLPDSETVKIYDVMVDYSHLIINLFYNLYVKERNTLCAGIHAETIVPVRKSECPDWWDEKVCEP
jgi:hypothetical protein